MRARWFLAPLIASLIAGVGVGGGYGWYAWWGPVTGTPEQVVARLHLRLAPRRLRKNIAFAVFVKDGGPAADSATAVAARFLRAL